MTHELAEDVFTVYTAFERTDYGQKLAEQVRYERYNLAQLPNDEWVRLLGADVNNLSHMPLTCGLAKSFIRATEAAEQGYFTEDEKTLLELAAIIHDQGEAIVGDISFGDKTAEHEAEEKLQFESNLDAFCPGASLEMKRLIVQARDEVVFAPTTKLGKVFNAIERTGYVRTALRAAQHLLDGTAGASTTGLEWIVADVLSNQPVKLIEYAAEYPAVESYLTAQSDKITIAFELVTPGIFKYYGENEATKRAQFQAAHSAWQSRIEN